MAKKSARGGSSSRVGQDTSSRAPKPPVDDVDALESKIWSVSKRGRLRDAAAVARRAQFDAGLSVVYQAGRHIVREDPTGHVEVLRPAPAAVPVPKRFQSFIVGRKKGRT